MPQRNTVNESKHHRNAPTVPSKAEIIASLQHDQGRAGMQLEWVLDRCAWREGDA